MVKSSFAFFVLVFHSFLAVSHCWCSYQSECQSNYTCCNHQCQFGSSCVGWSCTSQSDCGSGESCCSNLCRYGSDCEGSSCNTDNDCGYGGESCCSNVCRYESDCYGLPCNTDSDCDKFNLNCCDGACQYDDCDDTAAFFGLIFGSLVILFMFLMCISFAFRRRRALDLGRVMVGQRVTTTTTIRSATQSSSPYPRENPPAYQQGYPYLPPPQYEQHQTNRPPPYNPEPSTASEQPPPYTGGPHGVSSRIYTPQPSYGSVQLPPPV